MTKITIELDVKEAVLLSGTLADISCFMRGFGAGIKVGDPYGENPASFIELQRIGDFNWKLKEAIPEAEKLGGAI